MESQNEQFFPSEFILNYIDTAKGKQRFLTYTIFRFLSATEEKDTLLPFLKDKLGCSCTPSDFSVIENYLAEDYFFSPSIKADSNDALLLYFAICLADKDGSDFTAILEEFGLDADFSSQPQNCRDFYAALSVAVLQSSDTLDTMLPKFAAEYQESYRFTCEDFILFDFMDEYFEQKNCRLHPAFVELTDTLVAATLNYYNTDFGTLLETELQACAKGTSSRFAGMMRFGCMSLPAPIDNDRACHMLAELFRYAAIYELRNNLFDFHLEDDKLITLTNWKENLRWHYVQYSNVYEMTISSYYAATLSQRMLKKQFEDSVAKLNSMK